MYFSRTYNIRLIKFSLLFLFFATVFSFAIFKILNYIQGPRIAIDYPPNGYISDKDFLSINGQARQVSHIYLNGRPILTDEKGYWNDSIIIFAGINKINISANDRFGRKISKNIDIVGSF